METVLNVMSRWMIVLALMLAYWPFAHHATHATGTSSGVVISPAGGSSPRLLAGAQS